VYSRVRKCDYRAEVWEEYTQLFSVRSTPRSFASSLDAVEAYVAAVSWFWRLLADLSTQSPGLILGQSVLDVVVLKLALGQTYQTALSFRYHFISAVYWPILTSYQKDEQANPQNSVTKQFYIPVTALRLGIIPTNNQLEAQFLLCIFISLLYMFRATLCSSSGESIVSIQHLVYVNVCRWPSGMQDGHLHTVTYTRCCIDTIDSPDDEHKVARNM
jgi:hypothetical protein